MQTRIAFLLPWLFLFGNQTLADEAPPKVDMEAIATAGRRSQQKLRTTPASWTVDQIFSTGGKAHLAIDRSGSKQRTVISFEAPGAKRETLTIIVRDGRWYVTDSQGARKYRPFEASINPGAYLSFANSEPMFLTKPQPDLTPQPTSVQDGIATFRRTLTPEQIDQARSLINQLSKSAHDSPVEITPEERKKLDQVEETAEHGSTELIELSTGLRTEYGAPAVRVRVAGLRFSPDMPDDTFAVDRQKWEDFSNDPTTGDLNDLMMLSAITKAGPRDGQLLDTVTGRMRRLPYPGYFVMPMCFLSGRAKVLAVGITMDALTTRPYEIDLKTRKCVKIDGPAFENFGLFSSADLSPDGKTVAVVHLNAMPGGANPQIHLIDLATHTSTPLGAPTDANVALWTADGKHLLVDPLSTAGHTTGRRAVRSLALIDMQGTVTPLAEPREAHGATLLSDRQTILYEDAKSKRWRTCDLRGENGRPFADGMQNYSAPEPAPDGKRLMMMRTRRGEPSRPIIFSMDTWEGKEIPNVTGPALFTRWR